MTVTGKGESVKTIELVAHGYTVKYEAKSFSDTFSAIVNQCAAKMGDTASGTTTYAAKGPVTVHVQNTDADLHPARVGPHERTANNESGSPA